VFPLVGGRKVEHLQANLEALDIKLTPEQIKALEEVLPFDVGFPSNVVVSINFYLCVPATHMHSQQGDGTQDPMWVGMGGHTDRWPEAPALNP
jgi:hypothetical protein